jgi:hypothetical protein
VVFIRVQSGLGLIRRYGSGEPIAPVPWLVRVPDETARVDGAGVPIGVGLAGPVVVRCS